MRWKSAESESKKYIKLDLIKLKGVFLISANHNSKKRDANSAFLTGLEAKLHFKDRWKCHEPK